MTTLAASTTRRTSANEGAAVLPKDSVIDPRDLPKTAPLIDVEPSTQPAAIKPHETVREGDRGAAVFHLQERLNTFLKAHNLERIKVDGDFGPATKRTVIEVQSMLSKELKLSPPLATDGVWGPKSESALTSWEKAPRETPSSAPSPKASPSLTFEQEGYNRGTMYVFSAKKILDIDGQTFILCAPAADAFEKMRAAAASDGVVLKINSAFRTNEEQADLYKKFKSGRGNPANSPGHSDHQSGFAVDIRLRESSDVLVWLDKNAGRFGFDRPKHGQIENGRRVSNEPWHWEFVPERKRLHG